MKTFITMLVFAAFALFGFDTTTASAQTDWGAGWKSSGMRGTRDSWSQGRSSSRRAFVPSETRQMFSYEPLPFRVGDKVVIANDKAVLKVERTVLATLNKGQEFTVNRIQGPWVATIVEVDGKKLNGWVWFENVKTLKPAANVRTN